MPPVPDPVGRRPSSGARGRRRPRRALLVVVLVLALATALAPLAAPPAAAGPGDEATLCGDIELDDVLRIEPGETLRVCPGAFVHGDGALHVRGVLVAEGNATHPVRLAVPVHVDASNASRIDHAILEGGSPALVHAGGTLHVTHVTVRAAATGVHVNGTGAAPGPDGHGPRLRVEDAVLRDHARAAVEVEGPADVTLWNASVDGSARALRVHGSPGPTVTAHDLDVRGGRVLVDVRADAAAPPRVLVADSLLDARERVGDAVAVRLVTPDDDPEVWTPPPRPTLELHRVRLLDAAVGLHVEGADARVHSEGSTYVGHDVGARTDGAAVTFLGDRFQNERWDVEVHGPPDRVRLVNATFATERLCVVQRGCDPAGPLADGSPLAPPQVPLGPGLLLAAGFLAGVGLLAATVGRDAVRRDLVLPLVERVGPPEARDPAHRATVLRILENHPQAREEAVAVLAGLPPLVAACHLARLERAGKVASLREDGHRRYVPATADGDADPPDDRRPSAPSPGAPADPRAAPPDLPAAPAPGASLEGMERDVYLAIAGAPGSSQADVARELDASRQNVHYHVKKLEDKGLVRKVRDGRETLCYPVPGAPPSEG